MNLLDRLTEEMKTALKAGEKARLMTIRSLISAIKYAQVDQPELTQEGMVAVLQKEAKKRREASEAYQAGGRVEAAAKEEQELAVIEEYLPKGMSEEEIRELVTQAVKSKGNIFGEVMKEVMAQVKGRADGGLVAKLVKEGLLPQKT